MKPFKMSDLIVGRVKEVRQRRVLAEGWRFVDDSGFYPECPNGHRCKIVGDRVECPVCGAVSDVVVETWSPKLRRFV